MLKEARVICFLCFYTILNEFAISYFTDYSEFVLILLSAYTIIEYLIFSLVIYWSLKRKSLKRIILIAIPIFLLFSLYQYISGLSDKIDSLSITVENLILICFTLFYFFEQLVEPQDRFVYTSFRFWIILGILIYSTGTFFFFLQSDKLSDDQWKDWSLINYFCTILKIIFFSVAILMKKENSDNISEENPLLHDIFDRTLEFDPTNPEERT